jgi:hypothetical protein
LQKDWESPRIPRNPSNTTRRIIPNIILYDTICIYKHSHGTKREIYIHIVLYEYMNKIWNILFWTFAVVSITYIYYECTHIKEAAGIDDFMDIINPIPRVFNIIFNAFDTLGKFFRWIGSIVTCYIPGLLFWLFKHLICMVSKIVSFPDCFFYYALEIFGKILYLPIGIIFFFTGMSKTERQVWRSIEKIDVKIYSATGVHICHYSDAINAKCYKCPLEIGPLVHPPDWPL